MDAISLITSIFTVFFFLVLISYYVLLLKPKKIGKITDKFESIAVIIPAHNEEEFIEDCIKSVKRAKFNGKKEIIVVDDGSIDNTAKIVRKFDVKLLQTKHSGKSDSINLGMKHSKSDLVAIVDADSIIYRNSLLEIVKEVSQEHYAGACCVIKVKNRNRFLCIWPYIEQLFNSLMRSILSKINANITTPGPLSVYRRKALVEVGGFSTDGFSEDADIAIKLIRNGYKIGFSETAVAETNLPYDWKGFLRQRTRFARGMLKIFKKHLQINSAIIDVYTLPLMLFTYVQSVIMGSLTLYNIYSGYMDYFVQYGTYFSFDVVKFFFNWISIFGFGNWVFDVFTGNSPWTIITLIGIGSTFLSYPLYFYAIFKFDKKFDLLHLLPICFMAPFWWFIMVLYIICLPEMFAKTQYNIWKKNE